MSRSADAAQLYTDRSKCYLSFVSKVAYPEGICAYFHHSKLLKSDLHVLDAGCGTGIATLALKKAMLQRQLKPGMIKCFDITPKMLEIFEEELKAEAVEGIQVVHADVLHLETLPGDWKNFDLIISAAMMEYLPKERFVDALLGLRSLLSDAGCIVLFITRKNWLMKRLITSWWRANCYQQNELIDYFRRADFSDVKFSTFPLPYKHLSVWGHIVEAKIAV